MTEVTPDTPVEALPPAESDPAQRLLGVFLKPVQTLREIAERPDWLTPFLIIIFLSTVSWFAVVPRFDFEAVIQEQIDQNPQMAGMDIDFMVKAQRVSSYVFGVIGPPLMLLIVAGVYYLAFKMFGGEGTFKHYFSIVSYAWLPMLLGGLIGTVILLFQDSIRPDEFQTVMKTNLGAFVSAKTQPMLFALLSSFDIFTIWFLSLITIGLGYVSKLSRGATIGIVIALWIVAILGKIGFAAIGAAARAGG